jgi:hypothetical protein
VSLSLDQIVQIHLLCSSLIPERGVPTEHFNPLTLDDAGNMYLKTGGVDPARTFLYPARKYQFDNGTTSFGRSVVFADGSNYITPADFDDTRTGRFLILGAMILLLILLVTQKALRI